MIEGQPRWVFGPVPSRRLNRSLGIDTIPLKTCNWNCVYCQLGRTMPLTNERREYAPVPQIMQEVERALELHAGKIDWVTFVGSGEPTLHSRLGEMVRRVKDITSTPVAVITNGALLHRVDVQHELSAADAVLPSLDAGNAGLYRRINRPHPASTFPRLVEGLVAFRKHYRGQLWIEVMLVRGLNDSEQELQDIASVLDRIHPQEVQVNLPTRPPVEVWVHPPDADGLMRALAILGKVARVVHPAQGDFDLSSCSDIAAAVLAIISRHPVSQDDLERMLAYSAHESASNVMDDLRASGRTQVVERNGVQFWIGAPDRFPSDEQSMRTYPGN